MFGQTEEKLFVDREMLKTLSVGTRVEILKELKNISRRPSDLSRILRKGKSTIVEHLSLMIDAGLVKKSERGGWVFYELTQKGKEIVEGTSMKRIMFLLSSSAVAAVVGIALSLISVSRIPAIVAEKAEAAAIPAFEWPFSLFGVVIIILSIAGFIFSFYLRSKLCEVKM